MGYFVDFVDFRLINFAVFNVADIFVCVGCGLMFLWLFKFAEFDDEKKPEKKSAVTESAEESDDASDR
jgi:signal peptidase II